jgi:hypothetical protein
MKTSRITRAALGAAGVIAASAALAAPAHAALVATTTDCGTPEISKPFTAWGDQHDYKLVDDFEAGASGWKLTGNARVVAGNQPFQASGTRSLTIPAGASAVSPPVCVGHEEPTARFFARGFGTMAVSVQVTLFTGTVLTLPVGVDLGGNWAPSAAFGLIANFLPGPGDYTAVRLVFTPLLGEWQIDDVHVDPRARF